MRWQRRVARELAPLNLTLMQWLVLDTTNALITETGDAVSQQAIATRLEIDKMTVSHAMRALNNLALVDRGPDFLYCAWRIWVTKKGIDVLEEGRKRVACVSA